MIDHICDDDLFSCAGADGNVGAAIVGTTIALLYQHHSHFSTSDTSFDYKERQKDQKCSRDKIRVSEVYFLFCEQPFGIFITTSNIFHLPEHTA